MRKKESRRRVPVSAMAIIVFAVLVVLEMLLLAGALEIRSSTVARIAPWAYEPFLKLVGEHPESDTMKESAFDRTAGGADMPSGMAAVAGFNPEGLIIDLDTQAEESEDPETVVPAENPSNAVPADAAITNPVPAPSGNVVPVG